MKILFLSSGSRVPSARFRIMPYVSRFRAEGHRVTLAHSFPQKYDYFPWMGFRPSQLLKRSVRWWHWLGAKLRKYDLVYIDREIFDDASCDMEQRFREVCGKLVIDLCDAVFLRYPEKFERLMGMADLVVCGNPYLLKRLEKEHHRTVLVSESVDMDVYRAKDWSQSDEACPVLGWIGSSGNLRYFGACAEALRAVARDVRFRLKVVAPEATVLESIDLGGVDWEHEAWDPKREVEQVRSFDIGLMPLFLDEEWDLYKSGLKLVQYLAVGIPGIATPVGVNGDILQGARCGFAPRNTAEWEVGLRALLTDGEARRGMGSEGRSLVAGHYSVQANYPVMRDALQALVDG